MWIDSHAHLFDLAENELPELIAEARRESVSTIISTATDLKNSETVISQCVSYDEILGAAGISPFDVQNQNSTWQDELRKLLNNPRMIAVGEIGIDNTNPTYPALEEQIPFFREQLIIAREIDKPAVIHSRGAEEMAVEICLELGVKKALFHCFTGDSRSLQKIIESGYSISFSGIVTFKNSPLDDIVKLVPDNRLFIETDAPYLAPVPFRGQNNRPAMVRYTGDKIAAIKGISSDDLQVILEDNFRRLFSVELST
ncbi:MAG: TatD family hydrolase [Fibrobacter sp.]|nr:TatD family hydrolase [Fibrobacter sp.]